ncbi:MAG TPA: pyridine nucleotide-disulfide oxidoreductase [Xanthobacteraceae bacterium]
MTDSAIADFRVERFIAQRPNDRTAVGTSRPRTGTQADFSQYRPHPWKRLIPLAFSIAVAVVLWIGWLDRDDSSLTPKSGVGYWLGIAGSSLMLLLLLYPLRKRMRSLRIIGTVAFWFRAHMILGAWGAVLILWHANFRLGSINSNVALVAMLVVAASGVFGRYLYGQIHHGLYGRKAVVREILADAEALKGLISANLPVANRAVAQLNAFARLGTAAPDGVLAGLVWLPVISWHGAVARMLLIADARRVIALEGKRLGQSRTDQRRRLAAIADLVTLHVAAVKKAAAFVFYERLFSLWHFLHVPLFFLLVIAAIIHIFAAHFF